MPFNAIAIRRHLVGLFLIAGAAQAQSTINGLGFETVTEGHPTGWSTNGAQYEIRVDSVAPFAGRYSLRSRWTGTPPFSSANGFSVASLGIPADAYQGRRVRLTGYVRTQSVDAGYAGLWMRVDGPGNTTFAIDNMAPRGIHGTTPWTRYDIELPVDSDAIQIIFGAIHPGTGTAWFDSLSLESVGPPLRPVHRLGPVVTSAPALVKSYLNVVPLGDGSVFINDYVGRRVVWFDSLLTTSQPVLDSIAGRANSYGAVPGTLIRFRGDSLLFYSSATNAFLVLDQAGRVARVMAGVGVPPLSGGAITQIVGYSDALGLVYVARIAPSTRYPASMAPKEGEPDLVFHYEDSLVVMRMDLATRRADTLTRIYTGVNVTRTLRFGVSSGFTQSQPLYPFRDEVTMTSDGALAILRAHELRVEWITGNRPARQPIRIAYDWKRITDTDRAHMLDSINGRRLGTYDSTLKKWLSDSAAGKIALTRRLTPVGESVPRLVPVLRPAPPALTDAKEVPDYFPATTGGAMRADGDGGLWIQTNPPGMTYGAAVPFRVFDRKGAEGDPLTLPLGIGLGGFGPGVVYLVAYTATGMMLERVRIR